MSDCHLVGVKPTRKLMDEIIRDNPTLKEICHESSFDGSDSLYDMNEGFYDPGVDYATVVLWLRDPAWKRDQQ